MSEREQNRDDLLRGARARLAQEADALDDDTRRALRVARARALDGATRPRLSGWMPVTAAAAVAVVAVLAMRMTTRAPTVPELVDSADVMTDIELLAETENLALLEELEFYAWLSEAVEDVS